ncbi:hypothetical protein GCM10027615_64140 [Plantactinospora veratri]
MTLYEGVRLQQPAREPAGVVDSIGSFSWHDFVRVVDAIAAELAESVPKGVRTASATPALAASPAADECA